MGVGCSYGSADTWLQLFSCFVPLAAVAQLGVCITALSDRRQRAQPRLGHRLFPIAVVVGAIVAVIAFSAAAAQWYVAHRAFGGTLAKRTSYGVIIIGHGAWAAVIS